TDAEDSAKIYLQQLESSAPSSASTQRAVHDLSAAYLKKARDAAIAGNSTEQERWLNEARGLGMKPADIGALQRELAGARQKAVQADAERALRLARAALREGRLTDPGEGSAASYLSQLQSSDPANAALPDLGRELAARLLERARAAVLAGKSADADLAQATPPGIFDQAAINAGKHWRYAPLLVNGAAMEVPVRTRMRFELPN